MKIDTMKRKSSVLTAVAAALMVLTGCGQQRGGEKATATAVKTETVSKSTVSGSEVYVGQVEEQSATAVSFTSMGVLRQVLVSEGQSVKRGQTLATLDATSAQNALSSAKAQLDQAHDAMARMKQLHDEGSLAEIKWVEVQSQVQQAEAQYRLMQKQVDDCRLTAPVSGVVGSGVMQAGESVLPAQTVLKILNIDRVKVKVAMPEQEMSAKRKTASLTVAALDGAAFHSNTITRGVEGDLITHTYNIYVNVENPQHRLLPGMVANVTFVDTDAEPQISVPARCVGQRADGAHFVWTVKEGKAHQQTVGIGSIAGNRFVITEGLKEGDVVITEGYHKVGEGSAVR